MHSSSAKLTAAALQCKTVKLVAIWRARVGVVVCIGILMSDTVAIFFIFSVFNDARTDHVFIDTVDLFVLVTEITNVFDIFMFNSMVTVCTRRSPSPSSVGN